MHAEQASGRVPPPRPEPNAFAIASLILGVLWLGGLGSVLAVIFGYVGKRQIDEGGESQGGRGMAQAGFVLGCVGIFSLVVLVFLVVTLHHGASSPIATVQPSPSTEAPSAGMARSYAAIGFDICGVQRSQPLAADPEGTSSDAPGISTDGDGVIRIVSNIQADAGNSATLARFVQTYPKVVLTSSELGIPGSPVYTNGETCPTGTPQAGEAGAVMIFVWSSFTGPGSSVPVRYTNPADIKLADGQLITVAFVKPGTEAVKPPASTITALLNDRSASASG